MISRVKKKFHSQGGVTILFGLLGFMVAAMVSVTIVTAAVTAARRVENDRDVTQCHLALESAAQLIRDEMTGADSGTPTTVTITTTNGTNAYSSAGTFAEEMQTAVEAVIAYNADYQSPDKALEITVPGFDTVCVSYVMQTKDAANSRGDYYLIYTLSLDEASETLYLTMNGNAITKLNVTTISWETVSINGRQQ